METEYKDYTIYVDLHFVNLIDAESKEHARELVKANFIDEYNLELEDDEISFEEETNFEDLKKKMKEFENFLEQKGYDCSQEDCIKFLIACLDKKMEE